MPALAILEIYYDALPAEVSAPLKSGRQASHRRLLLVHTSCGATQPNDRLKSSRSPRGFRAVYSER